jgi:hypothetical protein
MSELLIIVLPPDTYDTFLDGRRGENRFRVVDADSYDARAWGFPTAARGRGVGLGL